MKELLSLTGYEYKKIFQRKATWIALLMMLGLVLFSGFGTVLGDVYVEGEKVGSQLESMQEERAAVRKLSGSYLDDQLLGDIQKANQKIQDPEFCMNTEEGWKRYKECMYPYGNILDILTLLEPAGAIESEGEEAAEGSASSLAQQKQVSLNAETFYGQRTAYMKQRYEAKELSAGEVKAHLSENEEAQIPFSYGWSGGFERFFALQYSTGMFLAFVVAICLAPLFAGEHATRMDQLILCSKYGKSKVIHAKLLTGFSFAVITSLVMFGVSLIEIMMIFGGDGGNLPVQISYSGFGLSVSMTMWQLTGLGLFCGVLSVCMVAAVVILCSQRMKSSFGAIIVVSLLVFVPMFLMGVPPTLRTWYILINSLPTMMMIPWTAVNDVMFHVGNGYYYFGQAVPVIYLVLMAGASILSYRGFKRCQIGK